MATKIELLAPAGNYEAFIAAVENGADAVYLGGRLFNARQFAGNFDNEQMKKALDYAHIRGVGIYLTLNTLIADSEMEEAVNFAGEAYAMGMDGIIVQDLGFAGVIRNLLPDFELHASTQMTVYNLKGVEELARLGFKRVVLARELSLKEIETIAKKSGLEIEIFVHGAQCVSYSGQCLMSSMIGGRSGNRGKCAQPCRLPYELVAEGSKASKTGMKGYIMSPKDLCAVEDLQGIIRAGVKSLKIEGRMKSPEYVATVVRTYRKYIDNALKVKDIETQKAEVEQLERKVAVEQQDKNDLLQIFNRGGLSKGYLFGKTGRDMMSYEKPKNWGVHIGEIISHDRVTNTVKVKIAGSLSIGDGIEVWNGEEESPGTIVTNIKVNGKSVNEVSGNVVAVIGSIKGRIFSGNKLYKTSEKRLVERARESFSGKYLKRVPVTAEIKIEQDRTIILKVEDGEGNKVEVSGAIIPETAVNKALTESRVVEQLKKTGSTPFDFAQINIALDDNLALPISEINNLRRIALEELEAKRKEHYIREASAKFELAGHINRQEKKSPICTADRITLFLYRFDNSMCYEELDVERIYLPFNIITESTGKDVIARIKKSKKEVFLWIPNITRGRYERLVEEKLDEAAEKGIDGIMIGSLGTLGLVDKHDGLKIAADFTVNAFNSFSIDELEKLGIGGITLSSELTLQQINSLKNSGSIEKEVAVYGRLPLMTSEYCPVGSIVGGMSSEKKCNAECTNNSYRLKDRMGMEFPVVCDRTDCRCTIFNANTVLVAEQLDRIRTSGVDLLRLNVTDEKFSDIKGIVSLHKEIMQSGKAISKESINMLNKIRDRGFTKGHFFRGV